VMQFASLGIMFYFVCLFFHCLNSKYTEMCHAAISVETHSIKGRNPFIFRQYFGVRQRNSISHHKDST